MSRITSFGLFWLRDEVEWAPGHGKRGVFMMPGHVGKQKQSRRVCDFRTQQGIYILYDNYGPVYAGLSGRRKDGSALGQRLKEHVNDKHKDDWSRFSWFGYDPVSKPDASGICSLEGNEAIDEATEVSATIRDTEALLLYILKPSRNSSMTKFGNAVEWAQVAFEDVEKFFGKID